MQEIISLKNIDLYYDDTKALSNVSLSIKNNENWVIFGANGSGKSSIIKLICNDVHAIKKDDSHCEIFGKERWNIWDLKSLLGIITNDLHSEYLSVQNTKGLDIVLSGFFDSIGLYEKPTAQEIEIANACMEFLGIEKLSYKQISTMSTGEARKCLIARALVSNPKCLILDEPTTGLDIVAQNDFIKLLKKLAKSDINIILITHHTEEIFEEITNVALVKNGEIKYNGLKENVLNSKNLCDIFNNDNINLIKQDNIYRCFIK